DRLERQQSKHTILGILRLRLEQPAAYRIDPLQDAIALPARAPLAQRPNRQVVGRELARLGGRAVARRPPVVAVLVEFEKVFHHCLGRRVGLPAAEFEGEERVARRIDLSALPLPLPILLPVAPEERGDELRLLLEIILADAEAAFAGGRE